MKRRDFICGAACFLGGIGLSEIKNKLNSPPKPTITKPEDYPKLEDELGGFTVCLATHCNLNCKGCDTYSPLAGKGEFITIEQFTKDITKLKELAPEREFHFAFLGGEPLLNPDVIPILKLKHKLYPNSNSDLLTNGILLNTMNDDFWQTIKDSNINLCITKYPINIDRTIYEKKAQQYGINIRYDIPRANKLFDINTHEVISEDYEQDGFPWGKNIIDLTGSQDYVEKRYNCHHIGYTHYCRGNIYYCYVHAYIQSFINYFKVNIPITKDDYIKIADVKDISDIDRFLSVPKPLCRFCKQCHNTCYGGNPLEWDFSKREITEWT